MMTDVNSVSSSSTSWYPMLLSSSLTKATKKGCNLHDLADYAVIQINDTHPSMVIPEMIRLLMERGILMDEAIDIVSKTCAYTNHTILAEALEKWTDPFLRESCSTVTADHLRVKQPCDKEI